MRSIPCVLVLLIVAAAPVAAQTGVRPATSPPAYPGVSVELPLDLRQLPSDVGKIRVACLMRFRDPGDTRIKVGSGAVELPAIAGRVSTTAVVDVAFTAPIAEGREVSYWCDLSAWRRSASDWIDITASTTHRRLALTPQPQTISGTLVWGAAPAGSTTEPSGRPTP